ILESRRCLFLATGAEKAEIVAKAIEGCVTSMISATALQFHPRCTVVIDEAAASRLKEADYYRWIFANDFHWKAYRDDVQPPKRQGQALELAAALPVNGNGAIS
ncbi:MAG TPA: hypothetical protein VN625_06205, partial [Desulfuromonadaceae bacterium]|nr:hypothetical protein [Desulfuromonadaceae bacterium]